MKNRARQDGAPRDRTTRSGAARNGAVSGLLLVGMFVAPAIAAEAGGGAAPKSRSLSRSKPASAAEEIIAAPTKAGGERQASGDKRSVVGRPARARRSPVTDSPAAISKNSGSKNTDRVFRNVTPPMGPVQFDSTIHPAEPPRRSLGRFIPKWKWKLPFGSKSKETAKKGVIVMPAAKQAASSNAKRQPNRSHAGLLSSGFKLPFSRGSASPAQEQEATPQKIVRRETVAPPTFDRLKHVTSEAQASSAAHLGKNTDDETATSKKMGGFFSRWKLPFFSKADDEPAPKTRIPTETRISRNVGPAPPVRQPVVASHKASSRARTVAKTPSSKTPSSKTPSSKTPSSKALSSGLQPNAAGSAKHRPSGPTALERKTAPPSRATANRPRSLHTAPLMTPQIASPDSPQRPVAAVASQRQVSAPATKNPPGSDWISIGDDSSILQKAPLNIVRRQHVTPMIAPSNSPATVASRGEDRGLSREKTTELASTKAITPPPALVAKSTPKRQQDRVHPIPPSAPVEKSASLAPPASPTSASRVLGDLVTAQRPSNAAPVTVLAPPAEKVVAAPVFEEFKAKPIPPKRAAAKLSSFPLGGEAPANQPSIAAFPKTATPSAALLDVKATLAARPADNIPHSRLSGSQPGTSRYASRSVIINRHAQTNPHVAEPAYLSTPSISVGVRMSKTLPMQRGVAKALAADTSICEVVLFSPKHVSIVGKSQGDTVVTLWFDDQSKAPASYAIHVGGEASSTELSKPLLKLQGLVRELFPKSRVSLRREQGKLVVRGNAPSILEAGQIISMIRQTGLDPVIVNEMQFQP